MFCGWFWASGSFDGVSHNCFYLGTIALQKSPSKRQYDCESLQVRLGESKSLTQVRIHCNLNFKNNIFLERNY
jgi:hypothetical protein